MPLAVLGGALDFDEESLRRSRPNEEPPIATIVRLFIWPCDSRVATTITRVAVRAKEGAYHVFAGGANSEFRLKLFFAWRVLLNRSVNRKKFQRVTLFS